MGRSARLPDVALRGARRLLTETDVLAVTRWASGWLGLAWAQALPGTRLPEKEFATGLADRARAQPSAQALAAVAAVRLTAPPEARPALDHAIAALRRSQPLPAWAEAPDWSPAQAWRGTDVWASVSIIFLEVSGPTAFTLFAPVDQVGGGRLGTLRVMEPGVAQTWTRGRSEDDVPLEVVPEPVERALSALADALRTTDRTFPQTQDEGYVSLRGLAWSLAREHLPRLVDQQPPGLSGTERADLLDAFFAGYACDTPAARRAAQLCLDYGDLAFHAGATAWTPHQVDPFLLDHLTRKVVLDAEEAAALPEVLPAWIGFCLRRRDVPERWIDPVLDVVAECLPEFRAALTGRGSLALGADLLARLEQRGVDLEDRQQVEEAVRSLNAERLARTLLEQ